MKALIRLFKCERAVAAIETAFILPAGLLLIIGVIEISIMLMAQSALDKAAAKGARVMRTGEAQTQSVNMEMAFRDFACGAVVAGNRPLQILDCDRKLEIQVRRFSDLATVKIPKPKATGENLLEIPGPGEFAVIRLYYDWEYLTPMLSTIIKKAGGGTTLEAGAAFRTENFSG